GRRRRPEGDRSRAEQGRKRRRDRPRRVAPAPAEPRIPLPGRCRGARTMIAALRAELVKVRRRRVLLVTAATAIAFTVGSTVIILASAERSGNPRGRGVTTESLSGAGGGTEVFTTAVSFAGTFLFVVFVGAVAVDFSRGTSRTMLLSEPRRVRLLAGKMAGVLLFAAVVLAAAEALTWVTARLLASHWDVATGDWISAAALGDALTDYGSVLFWVTGYA